MQVETAKACAPAESASASATLRRVFIATREINASRFHAGLLLAHNSSLQQQLLEPMLLVPALRDSLRVGSTGKLHRCRRLERESGVRHMRCVKSVACDEQVATEALAFDVGLQQ